MRWFPLAATLMAVPPVAHAQMLPDGGVTAQEVAKSMQDKGYRAEVSTDKQGDPMILSNTSGFKFRVFFYECDGKPRCKSLQYSSVFTWKAGSAEKVAVWNRTKRFGKVYLDEDSDPVIQMDMDVEHGATVEALVNNLERWNAVLASFVKYMKP